MVAWQSLGLIESRPCRVRNLWTGQDLGVHTGSFTARVDQHDVALVEIAPLG